jgi:predicted HD phosphohydrolase
MTMSTPYWAGDPERFVDDLFAWLRLAGATNYDEQVTQLEHALQTAALARQDGASEPDVVAALLHDVGHLLVGEHRGEGDFLGRDLRHEVVGAQWLARFFPATVCDPVRLHVPAKRWLCTVDEGYWQGLSEASKRSLAVQGGPMGREEVAVFQATAGWQEAVALRKRDDLGKQRGRRIPDLESFRGIVLSVLNI